MQGAKLSVMQVFFQPFEMLSERCIYDKFEYGFYSEEGGYPPKLVQPDASNLYINVSTKHIELAGSYKLFMTGSLNPRLT
jgi:hypothetical protein